MAVYRTQVTFPTDNALPRDYVTNTWHFENPSPVFPSDYDNVRDLLEDFYTAVPTGQSQTIASRMSGELNGPALVKIYDLSDAPPRAPIYESTFDITFATTDLLPSEVALVLSFQAERVSGLPQNRRRNRVYLGPFNTAAGATGTGAGRGRPSSTMTNVIQAAAQDLFDAANASVSWDWRIWSPYNSAALPVDNGWVDDAWDTQRRRGIAPSSRKTFS